MQLLVENRVLLVTGGTQGVGLAIALRAAASGARAIFITGRDEGRGLEAARQITEAGAAACFLAADLTEADTPQRIFESAISRFGQVDCLVNAAGLTNRAALIDAEVEGFDEIIAVNLRAPFFLMQHFVRQLRQRQSPGSAVNILSMNVYGGTPSLAVYAASKAALAIATKNAAHAHRHDRIRINGINMGWADTPAERKMQAETLGRGDSWLAEATSAQPFGRLLSADDVARLALFLLSDASVPMTGALIDQEQWVMGPRD